MATSTFKVFTRPAGSGPRVAGERGTETTITVDWDSPEAERTFAQRAIGIAIQGIFRASGDIPASYECKVSELAKRERGGFTMKATPENAQRLMSKLSDADMAVALEALGMNKSAIAAVLANRPKPSAPAPTVPAPTPANAPKRGRR